MTLLAPALLWSLLGAVPIVALHILRSRRTRETVSSTIEWEAVDEPVAASRPWQRLRASLPLLLQLLTLVALALALARPALPTGATSAEHVVVIVDTSASMGATDAKPTRLARAVEEARTLLADLGSSARASLISAGAPAKLVASEIAPGEVARALDDLTVSQGSFDDEATTSLALSLDRPDTSVEYVLVGDGNLDGAAVRMLPAGTRFVGVGDRGVNAGIAGLTVTGRGDAMRAIASVDNRSPDPIDVTVGFSVDGTEAGDETVRIPAREIAEVALDVPLGDRVEARLGVDDFLGVDDRAVALGSTASRVAVLSVGPPDPFLDALLDSMPLVDVTRAETSPLDAAALDGFDVLVLNQTSPPDETSIPWFAIQPPAGAPGVQVTGTLTNPVPALLRSESDLLADLDLSDLAFGSAQQVEAPAATTLIGAEGGPLLISGRSGSAPFLYLASALRDTNLGLLAAFPVLGDRIIGELGRTELGTGSLTVGDILPVDTVNGALVTTPSGRDIEVRSGSVRPTIDELGFWTLDSGDGRSRIIPVNVDRREIDIAPVRELAIPGAGTALDGDLVEQIRLLAPWMIALAAVAAALEWLAMRRRRGVSRRQWRVAAAMRAAVIGLCVLALVTPSILWGGNKTAVVLILDLSDSVAGSTGTVIDIATEVVEAQPNGTELGVVIVGANARVDAAVREELEWSAPGIELEGSATDLAAGLRVAGALAPSDRARRAVLISDGRPTIGDARQEAARLADAGIRLDYIPVDPALTNDAIVSEVRAPSRAADGDLVPVTVEVTVTTPQTVTVTLRREGTEVGSQVLELETGSTDVDFLVPAGDAGIARWEAEVAGPDNAVAANDVSTSSTRITDQPVVLLVEGRPDEGSGIEAALTATGIVVDRVDAQRELDLPLLAARDATVLVDVPATALSPVSLNSLDQAVRELGKGLLVVGGTSSFGPGAYLGSPLEELLPVRSEAPDDERLSNLSQVFAVDISGSMGGLSLR